ncbi:2-hydroxy-acid oxidase [Actinophytocola oryzae]|uniref:2-hydroxy-acid oxidase n=1 Tax=Actinophytocola oryzae TaxID=502181 RepID=UPI0010632B2F|nr:2-hydroxy-acid oxidase [Actinophytocola oryzae]
MSRPGPAASCAGPNLIRTERATFTGPARVLADDEHRAGVGAYLADLTRPFGIEPHAEWSGQSYGEMAASLLATTVAEPVDLLVLAFSVHDLWPGRATAAYLSRVCPGTPMSFALCDQGRAAAFTGLRVIGAYRPRRALLIVVEQASVPYDSPATPPARHRGVAMLFGDGPGSPVTGVHQYPDVAPDAVAGLTRAGIAELSTGHDEVCVVLGDGLAAAWPGHPDYTVVPAGQPATGAWWQLAEHLNGPAELVVVADYDPQLRYLCLTGFGT